MLPSPIVYFEPFSPYPSFLPGYFSPGTTPIRAVVGARGGGISAEPNEGDWSTGYGVIMAKHLHP